MRNKALIGIDELAKILGVKRSWIYQKTRLGKATIPHVKVGWYLRFDADEVLAYLKQKTN